MTTLNPTADQLAGLAQLVTDIQLDMVDGTGTERTTTKPTSRPPMPTGHLSELVDGWRIVTTWAQDWMDHSDLRGPQQADWPTVTQWLTTHWPNMADHHPAAAEFADEIDQLVLRLRRLRGDILRTWHPLPGRWTCPITTDQGACGGKLLEKMSDWIIQCPRCGTRWEGEQQYERLGVLLGCEVMVTVDQAATLAKVHRRTVNRWIDAALLPVADDMTGRRMVDKRDLAIVLLRRI